MNQKLFIPELIKAGFQKRKDTFTNQLAYIIYYDEKGTLRKETSWQSWRDKNIDPVDIENKPYSGFTLNKGILRDGYWGFEQALDRYNRDTSKSHSKYIIEDDLRNGGLKFYKLATTLTTTEGKTLSGKGDLREYCLSSQLTINQL